jgi:hypothetical protein
MSDTIDPWEVAPGSLSAAERVLSVIIDHGGGVSMTQVVAESGLNTSQVRGSLETLVEDGRIVARGQGPRRYHLATEAAPAPVTAQPVTPTVGVASHEERRLIGDAVVGGRTLSRTIDALCWALAGLALIVMGANSDTPFAILGGLAAGGYGAYIFLSVGSYWTSSIVYALAFFAVLGMFSSF